ncbi:MAG: hypothetical protein OXF79_20105 [Chloroflexi bacterium]|nr:hypothetical protein [Chloroflexota bacterium]
MMMRAARAAAYQEGSPFPGQRRRLRFRAALQQLPPDDHPGFFVSDEVGHAEIQGWWRPAIPLPFAGE